MLETLFAWTAGLQMLLHIEVWLALLFGAAIGIFFGAIPGLTAMMGVAVFIPISMAFEPIVGVALLIAIYKGGIYGGSIAGILVNVPGTPAAIPATLDGNPLARKGQANYALTADALSSLFGGLFGVTILLFIAPFVARFALRFGPAEFATLFLFAFTIVSQLAKGSMLKGWMAALVGFLIATIGFDPMVPTQRFTMGFIELQDGIPRVVALIGMFAGAEVYTQIERQVAGFKGKIIDVQGDRIKIKEILREWKDLLRASLIGTVIGMIPGPGAGTSAFIAYSDAKSRSKDPDSFGKGNIKGVMVSEAANNAMIGGALTTLFALGLPGDTVTTILYGGLLVQGISPGPSVFREQPVMMYGLLISTIFATLFFSLMGYFGAKHMSKVLSAPSYILWPTVWTLCFIGAYGIYNNLFDLKILFIFGFLGYLMKKIEVPLAPLSLAIILGGAFERNFRRSLIRYGFDLTIFFRRPISLAFILLTIFSVVFTIYRWQTKREN